MVLSHPESLVLRGVSVLGDGPAVSLRLGSYETKPQTTKATRQLQIRIAPATSGAASAAPAEAPRL